MMKAFWTLLLLMAYGPLVSQGFDCDAALYLIIYTQSKGESVIHKITEYEPEQFRYEEIRLSEKRRLTSLSYNVLDKYLYALDVDTYELVKIDKNGTIVPLIVPNSLNTDLEYHSGTISPDGSGILLIGFDPEAGKNTHFYTINLSRENFYAGFLGVTGEPAMIRDFATDPTSGIMYGYDNIQTKLVQLSIGGGVFTLDYPSTGVDIDALFFNVDGDLRGYSPERGMFAIDKNTGLTTFLGKGAEGSYADGCSCPYTYSFTKKVEPRDITPCEEFEVTYEYNNRLGIGQTWLDIRDTFPPGFEITSINSTIVEDFNVISGVGSNVLALENIIYLMGLNEIKITVLPANGYYGKFESRAVQWDFPLAFDEIQRSDDPLTTIEDDATYGAVLSKEEIGFDTEVVFNCDGDLATIQSPIMADSYLWSDGSTSDIIETGENGWIRLEAENECLLFIDSVFIDDFPGPKELILTGQSTIILGDPVLVIAGLDRGRIQEYRWTFRGNEIPCSSCPEAQFTPDQTGTLSLEVTDSDGCITSASLDITVDIIRHFYAPNSFSPNGDGINDMFVLQSSVAGQLKNWSIFNRWGGTVLDRQNVPLNENSFGWDGKFNGENLPTGVYIWTAVIEYFDGKVENRSGEITLIAY